ncbi:MAG: hypothetical protein HS108_09400 [Planctomycetes bacterium]|nr:hypothetical protein [Planctomycetota bacterium]MCL4729794.1 hypothetical protein [Planctomycetota bacterium]
MILCVLAALATPAFAATDWTEQYLFTTDHLTGESWRLYRLNDYTKNVPEEAKAVRLEQIAGLTLLERVPIDVERIELDSGYAELRTEHLTYLTKYKSLRSLRLSGVIESEILRALADIPSLASLTVPSLCVESARHIGRCRKLEQLHIFGTPDSTAVAHLSSSLRLKGLSINAASLTSDLLGAVSLHTGLQVLRLVYWPLDPTPRTVALNRPTADSWRALGSLSQITDLHIDVLGNTAGLTADLLADICEGKSLHAIELSVPMVSLSKAALSRILSSKHLQRVHLTSVCDETVDFELLLGQASSLRQLAIGPVRPQWRGLSKLKHLRALSLTLDDRFYAEADHRSLESLPPNLESLRISNWLPVEGVESLVRWKGASACRILEIQVDLGDGNAEAFGRVMKALHGFVALEHLKLKVRGLAITGVKPSDWKDLHKLPRLSKLGLFLGDSARSTLPILPNEPVGDEPYTFSQSALKEILASPSLKSLDLSYQWFEPDALTLFRESNLASLSLQGVRGLSNADLDVLAASSIEYLSLVGTGLTITVEQIRSFVSSGRRRLVALGISARQDRAATVEAVQGRSASAIVVLESTSQDD